jgi:EpsI family protein
MSETIATQCRDDNPSVESAAQRAPLGFRRFSPWGVVASFALLGGLLLVSQVLTQGHPDLPRRLLLEFPQQIGEYRSIKEVGLDKMTLDILQPTDVMLRIYQRSETEPPISYYIAFHGSQQEGSRVHSPKSCLPGAGWRIAEVRHVPLPWKGGESDANLVLVEQGLNKQLALFWIHSNGRIIANEYLARLYIFQDVFTRRRSDGALVRLMTTLDSNEGEQAAAARLFALAIPSLARLSEFLPD